MSAKTYLTVWGSVLEAFQKTERWLNKVLVLFSPPTISRDRINYAK